MGREVAGESRGMFARGVVGGGHAGLGDEDVEVGGTLRERSRYGGCYRRGSLDVAGWPEESSSSLLALN